MLKRIQRAVWGEEHELMLEEKCMKRYIAENPPKKRGAFAHLISSLHLGMLYLAVQKETDTKEREIGST